MDPTNPYAPPTAEVGPGADAPTDALAIRQEYIKHEASLRSFGGLYLFGGVSFLFVTVAVLPLLLSDEGFEGGWAILGLSIPLSLSYFWVGSGLRRLDPGVRLWASLLAALGSLSFPIGTLMGGYLLYLLHGAKGKVVFGDGYPQIVAATSHLKRPTSVLTWGFLGAFVLFVIIVVVMTYRDMSQLLSP